MSSSTERSSEVYTIGHSTHGIDTFLTLLEGHSIRAIGDVRSSPYSRMLPHFNREPLKLRLAGSQIKYVFLGKELGARTEDPSCYEDDRALYSRIARSENFLEGLERVGEGASRFRLALMCAEKDPLDCHRAILVARELEARGLRVRHILADGGLEEHSATVRRLRRKLRIAESDMFTSQAELDEDAYERQGARIAYQRPTRETAHD